MTNEDRIKAIEVLEVHKAHWEQLLDNGICDVLEGGKTIQALKVAIRALKNEQKEQNVGMCQQTVGEMSEKQTDGDLIRCLNEWSNAYKELLEDIRKMRNTEKTTISEEKTTIKGECLISKTELIRYINNWFEKEIYYHPYSKCKTIPTDELMDLIKQIPSAEKTAEWIEYDEYKYVCSNCHNSMMDMWNYCPNCGARMEEVEE